MKKLMLTWIVLCMSLTNTAAIAQPDQIALFIPAFEGPAELGRNVATVLNLRIWSTLRRKPWPHNPKDLDFGKGLIVWDPQAMPHQSHQQAETIASEINVLAQVALWGKAYPYGDGIVVQANVSIPSYRDYREQHNELWQVTLAGNPIIADIPRRRFELSSIVLDPAIIKHYSLPSALKIYANRKGGAPIGAVGSSYLGIQFEHQQGLAKVIADDVTGWVRLPHLSQTPSEISAFMGGLLKIFRSDWQGALSDMERVLDNPNTRTPLTIDAHLYAGLAMEKSGRSGMARFEKALKLNPYAKRSVRYLLMGHLSALARDPQQDNARVIVGQLQSAISNYHKLFAKDDPWLNSLKAALETYINQLT